MKVKTYALIRDCVERAAWFVPRRCEKRDVDPFSAGDGGMFVEIVSGAVMEELDAFFSWDDEEMDKA